MAEKGVSVRVSGQGKCTSILGTRRATWADANGPIVPNSACRWTDETSTANHPASAHSPTRHDPLLSLPSFILFYSSRQSSTTTPPPEPPASCLVIFRPITGSSSSRLTSDINSHTTLPAPSPPPPSYFSLLSESDSLRFSIASQNGVFACPCYLHLDYNTSPPLSTATKSWIPQRQ